jgi:TniQ
MPAPPQLGRSLVPIPGESLPGFLLRLSFRLNLPPARLAELTGLAAGRHSTSRLPAVLLAGIPEPGRHIFARMTRLSDGQVTGLGLAAWQERYPLPAWMPGKRRRLPMDRWSLFAPATRYCPECLAGDGSAIQESFGGPWLKDWHLPVVFACPVHQRLLEHRCPECGQAVHAGPGDRPAFALLPMMGLAGLHPVQCRTDLTPARAARSLPACCGARLDHAGPRQQASAGVLALQGKILRLLDPDGPASTVSAGTPARPGSYFADLRALGLLACSTWPAARHLSPSEETAAAIDQHVASLRQQEAERRAGSPASLSRTAPPPLDAAVSAGLAHIADRILAGTPDEARWQLRPLLPPGIREAGRTSWARWVTQSATPCSEGLRTAYEPLLWRYTRSGGPQDRRNALLRTHRWGPENVPALIPEDWYARHFTPLPGVSPKLARRTAALRLVQIIAGGSLAEAAEFLGISSGYGPWRRGGARVYSAVGLARSTARQQPDPLSFETGLRSLTRELSNPGMPLVNYQRRRQALETWSIGEDTWPSLAARRSLMARPESGDRKRQIASVYIWVRVTSGEPPFAPRPIQAAQPPQVQEDWRRSWDGIWRRLLHSSHPRSHYTRFRAELDAFAATLAKTIDTAAHT